MFEKIAGKAVEKPIGFTEGMPPDLYETWEELYNEYYEEENHEAD